MNDGGAEGGVFPVAVKSCARATPGVIKSKIETQNFKCKFMATRFLRMISISVWWRSIANALRADSVAKENGQDQ
jgi:hypothetical protein